MQSLASRRPYGQGVACAGVTTAPAANGDVSAFIDRLCAMPVDPIAPFEFESRFGCSARVFEHLEQHPSACISPGVVGLLVDPRAYADGDVQGDESMISVLATERATTAFKTTSVACAVHEHSLADEDEFLLLPRYCGNYYLVPARSVWCAGQTLASPKTNSAADAIARRVDRSTTRALRAYAHELGICWRPYAETALALGWGPTGGLSLVYGNADSLAPLERREYAHRQSVIVSGASAPRIAHPLIRRASSTTPRKVSQRATAYVLLDDNHDALFAPRRTRI